jgi:hypothetical protein
MDSYKMEISVHGAGEETIDRLNQTLTEKLTQTRYRNL